jgi:protease-4
VNRLLRWLGIAFIFTFVMPSALIAYSLLHTPAVPKNSVLHIVLDGPLPELARPNLVNLVSDRMHHSLRQVTAGIRQAAHDERIVGLVLDIRTGALGLAQVAELRDAVLAFKKSSKYNVAFLQTAGELGGGDRAYALATVADKVVLSPPGEINLNGLRAEVPFLKETLARAHVQPYTEQRYEFKNFANTFTQEAFTPEHLASLKQVLDDLQLTLLQMLAEGRHVDVAAAHRWVEEAPWSAQDALAHRLVDRLGYWDDIEAEVEKLAGHADAFLGLDAYTQKSQAKGAATQVAYIVGAGEITTGESGNNPVNPSDKIGSDTLAQAFRDAREAGSKAVLFRIDSPGGSYVASDLIRREVELTRRANIPVVVSMGNVAASGGYLIATDADHIVVEPGSITGSIGVFAASFALREALGHFFGAHFGVYETLPHPGNLNALDPPTAADKVRIGRVLDRIYNEFVSKVAQTRHRTYEQIHAVARGHIWSGRQAVDNGLADELGGVETALNYLRKRLKLKEDAAMDLITYPVPDTPLDMLRDYLSFNVRGHGINSTTLQTLWRQAQATFLQPPLDRNDVLAPVNSLP